MSYWKAVFQTRTDNGISNHCIVAYSKHDIGKHTIRAIDEIFFERSSITSDKFYKLLSLFNNKEVLRQYIEEVKDIKILLFCRELLFTLNSLVVTRYT